MSNKKLGEPDSSGRRRPEPIEINFVSGDLVIEAIGTQRIHGDTDDAG